MGSPGRKDDVDPTGGFLLVLNQLGVEGCVFESAWMFGCFFVDVC